MYKLFFFLTLFYFFFNQPVHSQLVDRRNIGGRNVAVPFQLLSADAISSGMGDAGSALRAKGGTFESGTAKAALTEERLGFNLTYTPWLKKLVSDRKLLYAGGFGRLSPKLTLTASINYLSYGQVDLIDENRSEIGSVEPSEFVGSIGLAKSFGPRFCLGMNVKLIGSNMYSGGINRNGMQSATTYCIDISSYHLFPLDRLPKGSSFAMALNLQNIGPKMSYFNQPNQKYFLPANLKIGGALKLVDQAGSALSFALDISKLLVPTVDFTQEKSVAEGIVSSFQNNEGLDDMGCSAGAEYVFLSRLAFRAGYNYQGHNRLLGSFFSLGTGFTNKKLALNFCYLIANPQKTFLSNTLRITFGYSVL